MSSPLTPTSMDHWKLGVPRSAFRELDQRLLADIGYGTPEFETRVTIVRRLGLIGQFVEMVALPGLMTGLVKVDGKGDRQRHTS